MIEYDKLDVCYFPNDNSLKAPGDRRRFVFFAKKKNILFDTFIKDKNYHLIYVVYGSNLSKIFKFIDNFSNIKIIFEMPDSNLSEGGWNNFLKGVGRFLLGKESRLYFDYRSPLKKIIKKSDAIVCTSLSQKKILQKFNKNIFITLDFFDDEIKYKKKNWIIDQKKKVLKLFWEGMIYNLKHLLILNEIFQKLDFEIHVVIVTDIKKNIFFGFYGIHIKSIVKNFNFSYEIYEWGKVDVSEIASKCDLGIIPISLTDIKATHKPENKLIFMWKMGLPVVVSAIPSYVDVMNLASINMYAKDSNEWIKILNDFYRITDEKQFLILKDRAEGIIRNKYSIKQQLNDWEAIFKSLNLNI